MLAVDDPEATSALTRVWNGTAYFIIEEIEFNDMPWINGKFLIIIN